MTAVAWCCLLRSRERASPMHQCAEVQGAAADNDDGGGGGGAAANDDDDA